MTLRLLGNVGDVLSLGVVGATMTSILPPLASLVVLVYTGLRTYGYIRWIRRGRPDERY